MKTLKTIQMVAKIGHVLSKIAFIFCIIGFCMCVCGILSVAFGAPTVQFGGISFESVLQEHGKSLGDVYMNLVAGAVVCAGSAVVTKFAEQYLDHERAAGTPFTIEGAKELQRLGILSVCIPVGTQILVQIIRAVFEKTMGGVGEIQFDVGSLVGVGIIMLIVSLLCRYGAETAAQNEESHEKSGEQV